MGCWRRGYKLSPLHIAVVADDLPAVRRLVKKEPTAVCERDILGLTPGDLARFLKRPEALVLLEPSWQMVCPALVCKKRSDQENALGERCYPFSPGQFKQYFDAEWWPYPCFESYDALVAIGQRIPWCYRRFWKWQLSSASGAQQYERGVQKAIAAPTAIGWVDAEVGYGLLAEKEYVTGEWIALYAGRVVDTMRGCQQQRSYRLEYPLAWWSFRRAWIDAALLGNCTRFINHGSAPNVALYPLLYRGLLLPVIIASQPICRGSWLSLDYEGNGWAELCKIA